MTYSKIGFGISIGHATTSNGTYTNFAEVLELTLPNSTVDKVKVYRSDNTAAVVEQIPGWIENGDAELTITYPAGGGASIQALRSVPLYFKVTYPLVGTQTVSGDTEVWNGFLCDIGKETPLKDAMKCKIKIAVNGDITPTAGS